MVNSRNLLVGSTLTLAFVAIFAYMRKNNLTADDITLVDACWGANADPTIGGGRMNSTCSDLQAAGYNWDTKIPCYNGFKEDTYYYTPREMWGLNSMGRRVKGENELVSAAKTRTEETPEFEEVLFRCAEVSSDPDFSADIPQTPPTETEERETWWRRRRRRRPPPPPPCDHSSRYNDHGNYKACSVSLAWDSTDEAECSGTKGGSGPVPYCHCTWFNKHMSGNHWLNRGCVRHDACLVGANQHGAVGVSMAAGFCCDEGLRRAAWRCTWRVFSCSDSSVKGGAVAISMVFAGHDGGCHRGSVMY